MLGKCHICSSAAYSDFNFVKGLKTSESEYQSAIQTAEADKPLVAQNVFIFMQTPKNLPNNRLVLPQGWSPLWELWEINPGSATDLCVGLIELIEFVEYHFQSFSFIALYRFCRFYIIQFGKTQMAHCSGFTRLKLVVMYFCLIFTEI